MFIYFHKAPIQYKIINEKTSFISSNLIFFLKETPFSRKELKVLKKHPFFIRISKYKD